MTTADKFKVFFPYSSENKDLLKSFVKSLNRQYPCDLLHDQKEGISGNPKKNCEQWATECDIAIILLTPDVVMDVNKFINTVELPIVFDRYKRGEQVEIISVIFEPCDYTLLPEKYQSWLFQTQWGQYPKSMGNVTSRKNEIIAFENLEDSDVNLYMQKLASYLRAIKKK